MVTDYVGDIRLLDRTAETDNVEEALVAFGIFRPLLNRQQCVQLSGDQDRVLHLALRVARVHVPSLNVDLRRGRVEILELQLTDLPAVHRVGIFSPEPLDIELNDSASDLLVRRETDLDLTVPELGMLHDVLHRVHDLGHAGLVVRTQKGCAVGGDERLPHIMKHLRELRRLQRQSRHTFQRNVPAVIFIDDLRLDVRSRSVRSGVHVGDESDCRHFRLDVRRDRAHHVTIFIKSGFHSESLQLVAQHAEQIQLLLRRWLAL